MRNLLEQLNRMKDLMVYEKGTPINEISTTVGGSTNVEKTKSSEVNVNSGGETKSSETNDDTKKSNDCIVIKASGEFVVDVDENSGAVTNFIKNLEAVVKNNPDFNQAKVKGGSMYITEITLQGFASNYYKGAIEPDFDNNWCKKWERRGNLYDGLCSDWEIKSFSGKKLSSYTGKKGENNQLASKRAENLYKALKEKLTKKAEEEGIKIDPNLKPKYLQGGTIYTENKVDENWKTRISQGKINPGQIVLCTATLCYELPKECTDACMEKDKEGNCKCKPGLKEVDGKCVCEKTNKPPDENCECKEKKKECPDKCMDIDDKGECKCKSGLKEIDDPENKGQKKCVCEDGSEPDEDCGCKKKKECPTCQELDEETNNCKCKAGLKEQKDAEGNITCVCEKEDEILNTAGESCKCEKKKTPPKCNQTYDIKGGRGKKENNFVTKSLQREWSFSGAGEVTITFDPLIVPDAFYIKYGDQEFWSGFVGDVYNTSEGLYTMASVSADIKNRFYKDIFPSDYTEENDTSVVDRLPRNFAAELVWYKQKDGLLEAINAEIGKVGGKPINSIFKKGDGNAEKITNSIVNTKEKLVNIYKSYGDVLKGDRSFTMKKLKDDDEKITILAFSPLAETIFKMKIECK